MEEIKLKDVIIAKLSDGSLKKLKYVREIGHSNLGCVEVENTHNFHAIHKDQIVSEVIQTAEGSYEYVDIEEEYGFEVDRSYFIYDPEGGGQGEGEGEGEDGEGDGEGEESDEEKDGEGEGKPKDGEGKPKDKPQPGEGEGKDKGDQEGQKGKGEGGDKPKEESQAEQGKPSSEGDDSEGQVASIVMAAQHPDEIDKEFIKGGKKKRF